MMRSLFSGVTGLKTHQTKMDVIGNNIANVNTVGFKSSSVTFSELMYQTTQNASGANPATGRAGVNAKQIGLGVTNGAINTNITTSGASQTTGNPFDVQITGDSFFIVSDGSNNFFTRAGAFYVDGVGNLAMTSNGFTVMGWQTVVDPETKEVQIKKDTVSALKITSPENMTSEPEATTNSYLGGIIDKNSTQLTSKDGLIVNLGIYDSLGYRYIAKCSIKKTDTDGEFEITATDLVDSKGYSLVHSKDEKGYEKTGYDADGGPGKSATITIEGGTGLLTYDTQTGVNTNVDADGNPVPMEIKIDGIDAFSYTDTSPINFYVNTSTMFDNNGTSTAAAKAGDTAGNGTGRKVGTMSGVAIQTDGKIFASYDNGTKLLLGQIAVASFPNPSGLEKVGENLYQTTQNSGAFDGIGIDITSDGIGKMQTGVLEMSNVDLSAEFTEMITTQRGFQANRRIITVYDSLLEELTNLKR